MQPYDYSKFSENCRDDIQAFRTSSQNHDVLDSEVHCMRGLENKLTLVASERVRKLRRGILLAIYDEQDRQDVAETYDEYAISDVASSFTRESQRQARSRAMVDAAEVSSMESDEDSSSNTNNVNAFFMRLNFNNLNHCHHKDDHLVQSPRHSPSVCASKGKHYRSSESLFLPPAA
jgi:hypothetical protein